MSLCSMLKEIGFKQKKNEPRGGSLQLPHVSLRRAKFLQKEDAFYQLAFLNFSKVNGKRLNIMGITGLLYTTKRTLKKLYDGQLPIKIEKSNDNLRKNNYRDPSFDVDS